MPTVVLVAFALYVVAFVDVLVVRSLARRAVRRADRPLAGDGLPTGSVLARGLLDAEGLGAVQVVDADVDAYRAASRELQLAGGRAGRVSAAAWAVAAHEAAHAGQHRAGVATWKRWWVLSGHTVWASVALPALLVVQVFVSSPVIVAASALCLLVLVSCAALSWRVERSATATARASLGASGLPADAVAEASRLLQWLGAAYIAESFIDTGFLDRVIDPLRGDPTDVGDDITQP
jgi:Zn-dependent membrane protease YugP